MSNSLTVDHKLKHCPMCGAIAVAPIPAKLSVLLAVCDVLVLKMLESLGRKIVREERGRFKEISGKPFHIAHTIWRPGVRMMKRTLDGAWEVVPALLDTHYNDGVSSDEISELLTGYVISLIQHKKEHSLELLTKQFAYKFDLDLEGNYG